MWEGKRGGGVESKSIDIEVVYVFPPPFPTSLSPCSCNPSLKAMFQHSQASLQELAAQRGELAARQVALQERAARCMELQHNLEERAGKGVGTGSYRKGKVAVPIFDGKQDSLCSGCVQ